MINLFIYVFFIAIVFFYTEISNLFGDFLYIMLIISTLILYYKELAKFLKNKIRYINKFKVNYNSDYKYSNNANINYTFNYSKEKFFLEMFNLNEKYTKDELKKAYRALSKLNHPDLNKSPKIEMYEINEGYEFLMKKDF